jgi:hypothetical protein
LLPNLYRRPSRPVSIRTPERLAARSTRLTWRRPVVPFLLAAPQGAVRGRHRPSSGPSMSPAYFTSVSWPASAGRVRGAHVELRRAGPEAGARRSTSGNDELPPHKPLGAGVKAQGPLRGGSSVPASTPTFGCRAAEGGSRTSQDLTGGSTDGSGQPRCRGLDAPRCGSRRRQHCGSRMRTRSGRPGAGRSSVHQRTNTCRSDSAA